mgnify:CR=1 FL=1
MLRTLACVLSGLLALCPAGALAQVVYPFEVEFSQLDIEYDGVLYTTTPYGSAAVSWYGHHDPLYFNLTVNGEWVVQNLPLLSPDGDGVLHTMHVTFSIAEALGDAVDEVEYSATLTDDVLSEPIGLENTAFVASSLSVLGPLTSVPLVLNGPGPKPKGAKVVDSASIDGVEELECGKNECVHAAVAMSLKRLNEKHTLGIDPAKISIAALKTVIPTPAGATVAWAIKKDAYMKRLKAPIETVYLTLNRNTTVAMAQMALEALKKGEAVEICTQPHCVKVIAIAELDNGHYSFTYRHDDKQGEAGGVVDHTSIYNPVTARFTGGAASFNGWPLVMVVVERKTP